MKKEKSDQELLNEYRKMCPGLSTEELVRLVRQEKQIRENVRENSVDTYVSPTKKQSAKGFQKKVKTNVAFDIAKAKPITMPKVYDHLGNVFNTRAEMCAHWGINSVLFHSRHMKGWSLKEILTKPVRHRRTTKEKLAEELLKWEKRNV